LKYRTTATPNWYCAADNDTKYDTQISNINSKLSSGIVKTVSAIIQVGAGTCFGQNLSSPQKSFYEFAKSFPYNGPERMPWGATIVGLGITDLQSASVPEAVNTFSYLSVETPVLHAYDAVIFLSNQYSVYGCDPGMMDGALLTLHYTE
jgi:hypothetical protein